MNVRLHQPSEQIACHRFGTAVEVSNSSSAARGQRWQFGRVVATCLSLIMAGCSALHQPSVQTIEHKLEVLNRIPRSEYKPIDLRLLGQTPPHEHLVDDGDIVGVYVEGAPGQDGNEIPVRFIDDPNVAPSIGFPTPVRDGGFIRVPQVGVLHVRGMTVGQIEDRIRHILTVERAELRPDRARIHVSLMWKRSVNVLVVRQEEVSNAHRVSPTNGPDLDRRSGQVVELPAFQNDVLHALLNTGGLPNGQAEDAVYVFKRRGIVGGGIRRDIRSFQAAPNPLTSSVTTAVDAPNIPSTPSNIQQVGFSDPQVVLQRPLFPPMAGHAGPLPTVQQFAPQQAPSCTPDPDSKHPSAVRIPLTAAEGQPACVSSHDVLLEDGDIVLVESREQDHFFTGGLLGGGQFALPRNYDLDVVDAVLLADSYQRFTQFNSPTRAIGGVSVLNRDVTIGASRVIIERTAPDGRKQRFLISLYKAMRDPNQRVVIEPGDRLFLEYTRTEAFFAFLERHLFDPFTSGAPQMLSN